MILMQQILSNSLSKMLQMKTEWKKAILFSLI